MNKVEKEIEIIEKEASAQEITLSKEYEFEGVKYKKLDFSKLDDLTGSDMVEINRIMTRRGIIDSSPELSLEYAFYMAAKAFGMPIEFFNQLSPKDCMKVKNRVQRFLLGLD